MSLFTKAEAERIAATVTQVEKQTAGEIVVSELPSSDDYGEVRLFVAVLVGLGAAAGAHLLWPGLVVGAVLAVQFGLGLLAWLLTRLPSVLRLVVPRERAAAAVQRAAQLAFLEHGVFGTRDRTGVLIFLSELEHRVVILGDEGIHARVHDAGWSELVSALVLAIKQQRACDGVCELVGKLGLQLEQAAPIREDDTNELPNHVRGPNKRV
jgi:putative membrane protein